MRRPLVTNHLRDMRALCRTGLEISRTCIESIIAVSSGFESRLSRQLDNVIAALEASSS